MDIRIEQNSEDYETKARPYFREQIEKLLGNYSFINSITIFFRGKKHKTKKIKLHARLKGKDVFVKASGAMHDIAFDLATQKLQRQAEKYKSKHYKH